MQQQDTARLTLTDADIDQIEQQMDHTSPIYLPTLVRELREARRLLRVLTEAVTR